MFFILGALFVLVGCIPLYIVFRRHSHYSEEQFKKARNRAVIVLVIDIIALILINVFFSFYTDFLWFKNLDYHTRFLIVLQTKIVLFIVGAGISFFFFFTLYRISTKHQRNRNVGIIAWPILGTITVILAIWASGLWDSFLLFANQASSSVNDPIFGRSIAFYLFSFSFITKVLGWIAFSLVTGIVFVGVFGNSTWQKTRGLGEKDISLEKQLSLIIHQLLILTGLLFIVIAINSFLGIYRLMYSTSGVVTGAGWTDVHIRTIGYYISTGIFAVIGILLISGSISNGLLKRVLALQSREDGGVRATSRSWIFPALAVAVLILFNGILPSAYQSLVVYPNEITLESAYIPHNISFTRAAYGITEDRIQERNYNIGKEITPQVTNQNENTIKNIRLWDWRALMSNLQQQQEIRLYYQFNDVDVDRYMIDGEYREVMLAVRELEKSAIPQQAQTWVSHHLKYTHGYGLVLLPVHEFLEQGQPKLLIRGIPPEDQIEGIEIVRPEIYYGEKTRDHVYVNTKQEEFDYPAGDKNAFTTYEGSGGVTLDSFFKRFIYAWKFDAHRQLFSGYITKETNLLFNRELRRRAHTIAPFLRFSQDPYPVITDDGRVKFIIDAFMVSNRYPYSELYAGSLNTFQGLNYIRNSVKVVIDAYDGTVTFYAVDPDDILLKTYRNIFPDLFTPLEEMPADIKRHIRYPADYLTIQAEMYRTYHMTDVTTFYQREDVWEFAMEKYRDGFYHVEPYYVMVHFPEQDKMEFVAMLPFTPKNKNVMNAWIAGRCDMPHYGKIISIPFPKGIEMLGPKQIEARIDQDADMSRALSLWSQRGSSVIRGNLLAVPLFHEKTIYILYAESIFLQAEEADLPEVKRVILADQNRVVWSEDFETTLRALVGEAAAPEQEGVPKTVAVDGKQVPTIDDEAVQRKINQAVETFNAYTEALSNTNFEKAGRQLDRLKEQIRELSAD